MRLTIDEYSKHFKMSKEMINSKIKNKKLSYIVENDTTYIIVAKAESGDDLILNKQKQVPKKNQTKALVKPKTTVAMVLSLYQRENRQLKEKILQLETKIDKLIDDKEQMLRDEIQKIEQVHYAKDEQLKSILELVNTKLIMDESNQTIHEVEHIEKKDDKEELVELKDYLKTLDTKAYQKKIIKKRFLNAHHHDIRILQKNGKIYLNFSKYDYSDLLKF
jgi:hypothetical protein